MKLSLPIVPNYIVTEDDNGNPNQPTPIENFTDEQLEKIAHLWAQELISRARSQRVRKNSKEGKTILI